VPGDVIIGKEGGGGGSLKLNTNTDYRFYTGLTEQLRITNSGNLGLGVTNPSQKLQVSGNAAISGKVFIGSVDPAVVTGTYLLAVNGSAIFNKVKVKEYGSGWPDYVFDKSYKLLSLTELKKYIETNKHLPDVPSATDVAKSGVDLAETQAILLKKIEELTLYIIKQNERIELLESKMKPIPQ